MLAKRSLQPSRAVNDLLESKGIAPIRNTASLVELLRRPNVSYDILQEMLGLPSLDDEVKKQVEISIFYEGYIKKQMEQVERMEKLENKLLPEGLDYGKITSLRDEAREKLSAIRPRSVGQAGRISGVSPADVSVLLVYLEKERRERSAGA